MLRTLLLLLVSFTISTAFADANQDAAALVEQGQQDLAQSNYKDAQIKFRKAIALDAKNADAFHGAGICCLELKEYPEAVGVLEKAKTFSEKPSRPLLLNLAIARLLNGKPRAATEDCKVYLESASLDLRGYELYQAAFYRTCIDDPDDLESLRSFLKDYTQKTDALRKNEKRWGEEWRRAEDVEKHRSAVAEHYKDMNDARKDMIKTQQAIEAAEKAVDNTDSRGRHAGALGDRKQQLNHARNAHEKATNRYEKSRAEFEAALPPLLHALDPLGMNDLMPTTDESTPLTPTGSNQRRKGK